MNYLIMVTKNEVKNKNKMDYSLYCKDQLWEKIRYDLREIS